MSACVKYGKGSYPPAVTAHDEGGRSLLSSWVLEWGFSHHHRGLIAELQCLRRYHLRIARMRDVLDSIPPGSLGRFHSLGWTNWGCFLSWKQGPAWMKFSITKGRSFCSKCQSHTHTPLDKGCKYQKARVRSFVCNIPGPSPQKSTYPLLRAVIDRWVHGTWY